jgi:hypothetical protein
MDSTKYVSMSVTPEARAALADMAKWLSDELHRKVTLSEALEMTMRAVWREEFDVAAGES